MEDTHYRRFEQLIAAHTGLQLRPREYDAMRGALAERMSVLRLRHADDYHHLLKAGTPDAEREWQQLTVRLTNNESYFFRDIGQMTLLRERILPEIIERNRDRRTLRIWSAGCATGEEAYSLAIMVEELLPGRGAESGQKWDIVILGTDIDEDALRQAVRGVYGSWSFRAMDTVQQRRCIKRHEDGRQVAEDVRSLVTFSPCNLVGDPFPSAATGIYEMDLILCRNVFIYFGREAVSVVLPKFARTLRAGGYLMTGHGEIQGLSAEPLSARAYPESVVYQRVSRTPVHIEPRVSAEHVRRSAPDTERRGKPAVPKPDVTPSVTSDSASASPAAADSASSIAETLYAGGDYTAVIETLQPSRESADPGLLVLLAHAHANLGRYQEATDCCRILMELCPSAPEPYELLAFIAQEQQRRDEAKLLLKQALYLAPKSPSAYLELGALYHGEGDTARAGKMNATALELLRAMPPEANVGAPGAPTAHEWILHLQQLLTEGH